MRVWSLSPQDIQIPLHRVGYFNGVVLLNIFDNYSKNTYICRIGRICDQVDPAPAAQVFATFHPKPHRSSLKLWQQQPRQGRGARLGR